MENNRVIVKAINDELFSCDLRNLVYQKGLYVTPLNKLLFVPVEVKDSIGFFGNFDNSEFYVYKTDNNVYECTINNLIKFDNIIEAYECACDLYSKKITSSFNNDNYLVNENLFLSDYSNYIDRDLKLYLNTHTIGICSDRKYDTRYYHVYSFYNNKDLYNYGPFDNNGRIECVDYTTNFNEALYKARKKLIYSEFINNCFDNYLYYKDGLLYFNDNKVENINNLEICDNLGVKSDEVIGISNCNIFGFKYYSVYLGNIFSYERGLEYDYYIIPCITFEEAINISSKLNCIKELKSYKSSEQFIIENWKLLKKYKDEGFDKIVSQAVDYFSYKDQISLKKEI